MAYTKNGVEFRLDAPGVDEGDLYNKDAYKGGNVTSEELRKEYSRLRQVAVKRLARMEGTKYERSQTYRYNIGKFTSIPEIEAKFSTSNKKYSPETLRKKTDAEIAAKLAEMYKFLTAKSGSIRGLQAIENRTIEALHDRGLTFINKGNIQQFGEYMQYLKALDQSSQFDSERAADVFGTVVRKGINPQEVLEDYKYWEQHETELSAMPKITNEKKRTAEEYKRLLESESKTSKKKK